MPKRPASKPIVIVEIIDGHMYALLITKGMLLKLRNTGAYKGIDLFDLIMEMLREHGGLNYIARVIGSMDTAYENTPL